MKVEDGPDGLGRATCNEHQTTILKTKAYSRILALTPIPFYEYRFVNTREMEFAKIVFAWTEDRALRGRNLSADPRLRAMGRVSRDALPFLLIRSAWIVLQHCF